MNILITNAEGYLSPGLKVLQESARAFFREATIITIAPTQGSPYRSMAANFGIDLSNFNLGHLDKMGTNFYRTEKLSSTDIVDLAFLRQDLFIPSKATWDLVLVGVAPGAVTGTDTYRSATTGAGMYAATAYKCAAYAFMQDMELDALEGPSPPAEFYAPTRNIIADLFKTSNHLPGECWAVNFPAQSPQGYRTVPIAHYSRRRMPPTSIIPRSRDEKSDATELQKGFVTLALLNLRVNQPLRF